jgi:hypothetical protein
MPLPPTLRHVHLHRSWFPRKPGLAWVERLPGPPRGPARLPRKACRNKQQHLGRGRCRLPPAGRFRGSSPQRDDNASSLGRGDRPASHPKERRRKGPRPRQARVKGIEVCLVSEETGRPTITETRRGYKPAVPVPATPPEGEEARHTQQQARDRRQSWRGKHLRRSASPALTTNDRPRAATTRCRNP